MQTNDALFPTTTLPKALAPAAEQAQQRLSEALSQADNIASMTKQPLPSSSWEALAPARREALARVVTISTFALDTLARFPHWLAELDAADRAKRKAPPRGCGVAFASPRTWRRSPRSSRPSPHRKPTRLTPSGRGRCLRRRSRSSASVTRSGSAARRSRTAY